MFSNIETQESEIINEEVDLSSSDQEVQEIAEESKPKLNVRDILLMEKVKAFNNSIYVGNLDHKITKKELDDHFTRCGLINNIRIPVFKVSGLPKGHAYIEFFDENSMFGAVCMDGTYLYDKPIEVLPRKSNKPVSTARYYTHIFGPFPEVTDSDKEDEQEESLNSSIDGGMTKEEMSNWQRSEAVMKVRRWRVNHKPY